MLNVFMLNTHESIQNQFGKKVREARTKLGYSQEGFAFECGLHRTYIGCIERGEKNITITNIDKIAKALGVGISVLFADLEKKK
jgi:transcriptional regulator with XRE-family HTH domain